MAQKKINIDELTNIVKVSNAPPDVIVLSGFVGESSRKGYVRLYLTPELNDYVEIQEENVQRQEQIPKEKNGLGGSHLWVDREAKVIRKKTESKTMQADFLKGEIMKEHLAATYKVDASLIDIRLKPTIFGNTCDHRYCYILSGKPWCDESILKPGGCLIELETRIGPTCNPHYCPPL